MFIRSLQFRAEVIVYSVLDIIPFLALFFIWSAIYSQVDSIHAYTLPDIISYFLLVIIIERLTATHFEGWRSEEIRKGKIDFFLTRPFSYISEVFAKDIAAKIISIFFSLPALIIFCVINISIFHIPFALPPLLSLITFSALMVIAYAIQLMIALWIVLLTFWFEGSSGLEHFKWIALTLFSGALIPLEFMPSILKTLTNYLPLKYLFSVPIQVLQSHYLLGWSDVFTIILTLITMIVISKLLWSKAQLAYTSNGG